MANTKGLLHHFLGVDVSAEDRLLNVLLPLCKLVYMMDFRMNVSIVSRRLIQALWQLADGLLCNLTAREQVGAQVEFNLHFSEVINLDQPISEENSHLIAVVQLRSTELQDGGTEPLDVNSCLFLEGVDSEHRR